MAWYVVYKKNKHADVAICFAKSGRNKYARNAPNESFPSEEACINRAKKLGYSYIVLKDEVAVNKPTVKRPTYYPFTEKNGNIIIDTDSGQQTLKKPLPYDGVISEYSKYLESAHWHKVRDIRLKIDKHTCQMCGAIEHLQVHHISYKTIGNEKMRDLITLCEDCHKAIHDKNGKSK